MDDPIGRAQKPPMGARPKSSKPTANSGTRKIPNQETIRPTTAKVRPALKRPSTAQT